mmetsp:Transcript_1919/g.3922  ORF Transcript_1919/g.3922 Transcript_1919/m.3922 type:complete len:144 (+) Transcript_1919:641-1072(+)
MLFKLIPDISVRELFSVFVRILDCLVGCLLMLPRLLILLNVDISAASQNRIQTLTQQQQQPPAPPSNLDNVHCHYTVLGITQTASSAEIKKAYHKMALKYHPDKNSEEGAADIFRRVKMAYEILGNDQTRISYDAERRRGGRR